MNTSSPTAFDPADIEALTRLASEYFKDSRGGNDLAHGSPDIASPRVSSFGTAAKAPTAATPAPGALNPNASRPEFSVSPPTAQLRSEAPALLALPAVYGAAAEIPRPRNTGPQPADPLRAAREASYPAYYFQEAERSIFHTIAREPHIPRIATPGHFDAYLLRQDFPILGERVNGRPLVWLDNAATTQKPQVVIDRLSKFYSHENSNVHRAAHELAARATDAYEAARATAQHFINARSSNEVIFVRGATEAINLVAQSWGQQNIRAGDEIIVSWLEHHANIVPWKRLADEVGATLKVIPVSDKGELLLDEYARLLTARTKLVAVTQVANAIGTITPTKQIVDMAHAVGARALIDGAQSVLHMPTDVQALGADWFVFSGHKVFGPTGIGVLYGKEDLLNGTVPWQGGGNMIADVTFERIVYQDAPARFEAGTGNIADAVGLASALDYVQAVGLPAISAYEHELLRYGTRLLCDIPGLRLIGTAPEKAGVLSFVLDGVETTKIGGALNREGIAVRSGHHCAQPILRRLGVEATVRASLALYNTHADLDALASAVQRIKSGHLAV
jgi:cysteine desulfurase/selenocysteine lyase